MGIVKYPIMADCAWCRQTIQFDIDTDGTPGSNGDWATLDGDYGCDKAPGTNEDATDGHSPVSLTWEG